MTLTSVTSVIVFIIGVDLICKHVVTMATKKKQTNRYDIYIYIYIRLLSQHNSKENVIKLLI